MHVLYLALFCNIFILQIRPNKDIEAYNEGAPKRGPLKRPMIIVKASALLWALLLKVQKGGGQSGQNRVTLAQDCDDMLLARLGMGEGERGQTKVLEAEPSYRHGLQQGGQLKSCPLSGRGR